MSKHWRVDENSGNLELQYAGREIICSVTHAPSQRDGNLYCTLYPVMLADSCQPAQREEFPDRGLVWCFSNVASITNLLVPGKLLSVIVEASRDQADGRDKYQVRRGTIKELHESGFYEVLKIPTPDFKTESEIVAKSLSLRHSPAPLVFALWNNQLLGPFRTTVTEMAGLASWNVTLSTQRTGNEVSRIAVNKSSAFKQLGWQTICVKHNKGGRVGGDHDLMHSSECLLLKKESLDADIVDAENIRLESDVDLVFRVTKSLLKRKEKSEVKDFLDKLAGRLNSEQPLDYESAIAAISRLQEYDQLSIQVAQSIADSIIDSGFLADQIHRSVEAEALRQTDRINQLVGLQSRDKKLELEELQRCCDQRREEHKRLEADFESDVRRRESAIERRERELEDKERVLQEVLLPVSEAVKATSTSLLQDVARLHLLFPELMAVNATPSNKFSRKIPELSLAPLRGGRFRDEAEFIQQRLHPVLSKWNSGLTGAHVQNLYGCFLGSRCVLLPEIYAAWAIAEALGAAFALYHVAPDWLDPNSLWEAGLGSTWEQAVNNPEHLFIITVSGVNLSPSAAWARPLLTHSAFFGHGQTGLFAGLWPENLRMAFIWDRPDEVTFPLDTTFRVACSAWNPTTEGTTDLSLDVHPGFVHADTWAQWSSSAEDYGRGLEAVFSDYHIGSTWRRRAIVDVRRIAGALIRLGTDLSSAIKVASHLRLEAPHKAAIRND